MTKATQAARRPASTPAERGALLLAQRLGRGAYRIEEVASWLLPEGFPYRLQLDRPHEAIVHAIHALPDVGQPARPVREALAGALAGLIESRPEESDRLGRRDILLGELYSLARILQVNDVLADPLFHAFRRGMPKDICGEFGPPQRDLLRATISNQSGNRLADDWLTLLRFPEDDPAGQSLRSAWRAHWYDGWAGVCEMEAEPGAGRPSIAAVVAAEPQLAHWVEAEVEADPTAEDKASERVSRYLELLDEVSIRWPSVIDQRDITNLWVFAEGMPAWCGATVFSDSTEKRIGQLSFQHFLNTIRKSVAKADLDDPRMLTRALQPWMHKTMFPSDHSQLRAQIFLLDNPDPTLRAATYAFMLRYLRRESLDKRIPVAAFKRWFSMGNPYLIDFDRPVKQHDRVPI